MAEICYRERERREKRKKDKKYKGKLDYARKLTDSGGQTPEARAGLLTGQLRQKRRLNSGPVRVF